MTRAIPGAPTRPMRRALVVATAVCALRPFTVLAQPAAGVRRVGSLVYTPRAVAQRYVDAFEQGLIERGYRPGVDVVFEHRFAEGDATRLEALAQELVRARVDVIVASTDAIALAIRQVSSDVPIVMTASSNPVGLKLIRSLSHPGGKTTGLTFDPGPELNAKPLQYLREFVPSLSRVAVLRVPSPMWGHLEGPATQSATGLGLALDFIDLPSSGALDSAFAALKMQRAQAMMFWAGAGIAQTWMRQIAQRAWRERLPSASQQLDYARDGGLLAYGPPVPELYHRAAVHVDKILRGADPGELPMEQPTRLELVVNVRCARVLGLAVPKSILLRADEVIEE